MYLIAPGKQKLTYRPDPLQSETCLPKIFIGGFMESILIPTLSTPTQSHGHQVIDFSVTGQFTLGHAQNKTVT